MAGLDDLVPDILDGKVEGTELKVTYKGKSFGNGDELTVDGTKSAPEVSWKTDDDSKYALLMVDPDAPSRADPKYRQSRHWLISGIKSAPQGSTNETHGLASLKTKAAIAPYRPPNPGPGSGIHRYVFLLFEEPIGGYEIPASAPEHGAGLEQRRGWNGITFGEKYGLKLVGADFFLLRAVDSVSVAV